MYKDDGVRGKGTRLPRVPKPRALTHLWSWLGAGGGVLFVFPYVPGVLLQSRHAGWVLGQNSEEKQPPSLPSGLRACGILPMPFTSKPSGAQTSVWGHLGNVKRTKDGDFGGRPT